MAGLGLGLGSMGAADDEFDEDEYADDAMPMSDDEDMDLEGAGGPFEAYADTLLNPELPIEERTDALRQAIQTIIEEGGTL